MTTSNPFDFSGPFANETCAKCGEHEMDCVCAERHARDAEFDAFQAEED